MTVLKARFECDICGQRKTISRRKIAKWEHCLEIKRGFKVKPVDICPKCTSKPIPKDRIFMRTMFGMDGGGPDPPISDKYMA
jgi:hypothetical protein